MERERISLLELKIKKQLSAIMELSNNKGILANIDDLLGENPETNKDVRVFTELVGLGKDKVISLRDSSILLLAGFLWKYEGTYMLCTDIFCYTLVANGHDLYNPITRQYVDSIEDIVEVDMSTKLKFLERHDFDVFIRKQDQKLRNKIAHHDYHFDNAGNVLLGNVRLDIRSRFVDFATFAGDAFITLCKCLIESMKTSKT